MKRPTPAQAFRGVLAIAALLCASALAAPRVFVLSPEQSSVTLHVDKTGLFSGLGGHEHNVSAPAFSGRVTLAPDDPSENQVFVTFDARALRVMPEGEPPDDVAPVQETMLGPKVLDAARYPTIRFTSRRIAVRPVSAGKLEAHVEGVLELHGTVRNMNLLVQVESSSDRLVATGETTLKQSDFKIDPVSAAGGTVKVKDELTVKLRLVGRAAP
jgi:polyisoprenoid-binding protein YceI